MALEAEETYCCHGEELVEGAQEDSNADGGQQDVQPLGHLRYAFPRDLVATISCAEDLIASLAGPNGRARRAWRRVASKRAVGFIGTIRAQERTRLGRLTVLSSLCHGHFRHGKKFTSPRSYLAVTGMGRDGSSNSRRCSNPAISSSGPCSRDLARGRPIAGTRPVSPDRTVHRLMALPAPLPCPYLLVEIRTASKPCLSRLTGLPLWSGPSLATSGPDVGRSGSKVGSVRGLGCEGRGATIQSKSCCSTLCLNGPSSRITQAGEDSHPI